MAKRIVALTVNGRAREDAVADSLLLLDYLREQAGLTGTKRGCDGGECGACGGLRVEIHVVEAGDPAAQHLYTGEERPVVNELGGEVLRLGRPHVVFQPHHQRKIVGEPAHQRHGRVRVQVDEARDERVAGEGGAPRGGVALARRADGQQLADASVHHHDRVVGENLPGRIDRNDPASLDDNWN